MNNNKEEKHRNKFIFFGNQDDSQDQLDNNYNSQNDYFNQNNNMNNNYNNQFNNNSNQNQFFNNYDSNPGFNNQNMNQMPNNSNQSFGNFNQNDYFNQNNEMNNNYNNQSFNNTPGEKKENFFSNFINFLKNDPKKSKLFKIISIAVLAVILIVVVALILVFKKDAGDNNFVERTFNLENKIPVNDSLNVTIHMASNYIEPESGDTYYAFPIDFDNSYEVLDSVDTFKVSLYDTSSKNISCSLYKEPNPLTENKFKILLGESNGYLICKYDSKFKTPTFLLFDFSDDTMSFYVTGNPDSDDTQQ